ncbi:hypothetical protein COU78_03820 [Candidatus Peregrinibacteria bacterium CG10_big_fil_rev_8_21_14_0_10_49_24]|nr:MAG: hypothetical protein COV83_05635 [Candidatus Peregrinibacteria bacterium CG11_big_fil_rev_8_21_14_0_20_49_14]PIR51244.1 MAG: hypothetical protein COU78_03820 [Candidatus Peregrinibacteria bacterium CG10_big_fil_rev_8_21_14_0_10_49_24]PJA67282.1 MAG: hypothetical protein CO157_05975 [Candidatus Peregrinibacteria bacterium CG_4_9_14_3_um_filter_49_12]
MGNFIINTVLMLLGFSLIKFRERIADMIGDAYWMRYVGGVYLFVVIVGVITFFFGVARMTGTTDILMAPIYGIIPSMGEPAPPQF